MTAETDVIAGRSPGALSAILAHLARGPAIAPEGAWAIPLRPGDRVGRYEVVRELARGGFGAVYEALDLELGRAVAVKTVRPGRGLTAEGGAAWLHEEAEAVGSLSHPGIVAVHDVGAQDGAPYVVMELLRGETLAARLERRRLSCGEALRIAGDVAAALAYAHGRGVLHRDLKPGNVFLCEDGTTKLLDFGLSHVFGHGGWRRGGTPAYLAPERWRGGAEDARGDLFALGVLLHEMLAGRVPYPATEGHSAALEPGPPPPLPAKRAPRRLRVLVAAALAKDPAGRPASAEAFLAELRAVERRLARQGAWLWALRIGALVAAVAALAGGALLRTREPALPPGERLAVVVADLANETGDRELDGLSGLLITSLEQSRRLEVLTRSRMSDLLRQLGRQGAPQVDEDLARELGLRAGAGAVLVGAIRRFEGTYTLELRGLDPRRDTYLFAAREEAGRKQEVPAALDRLSAKARSGLRESDDEIRARAVRVAEAVTPNLEAYQHYFAALDCMQRPSRHGEQATACVPELRRAVELDPTFALAWLQLAMVGWQEQSTPTGEQRAALGEALRFADRVPPKERALIHAWSAVLEDRIDDAVASLDAVLAEFPADKQALYLAGDLLWHREELAAAVPYLERVLALDPTFDYALDHLAFAHAVLGNREALAGWVRRWEALPPEAPVLRALVGGYLGLGDGAAAVAAAERGLALGPTEFARATLANALVHTADYAGLERALRPRAARLGFTGHVHLAHALAAQGRRKEALAVLRELERFERRERGGEDPEDTWFVRAVLLADGDPAALRGDLEALRSRAPGKAAKLAAYLARLGAVDEARALATGLVEGTAVREQVEALVDWREGRVERARARLDVLEREHPLPLFGFAPAFARAELEAGAGRDAEALSALDRYDRLPFQRIWRSWAYPRSLLLRARSLARLGRDAEARAALERLEALWVNADPGLPLVEETRLLRSRLGGPRE